MYPPGPFWRSLCEWQSATGGKLAGDGEGEIEGVLRMLLEKPQRGSGSSVRRLPLEIDEESGLQDPL